MPLRPARRFEPQVHGGRRERRRRRERLRSCRPLQLVAEHAPVALVRAVVEAHGKIASHEVVARAR